MSHKEKASRAYDFLGLRMAVDMSFGPGWGGAPLGSAIVVNEVELDGHCRIYKVEVGDARPIWTWQNMTKEISKRSTSTVSL